MTPNLSNIFQVDIIYKRSDDKSKAEARSF